MDTRRTQRKRRNSVLSGPEPSSSALRSKTRGASDIVPTSCCETPRQRTKRVRFSDPGSRLDQCPDYSTGLTPSMLRTSFEEREGADALKSSPSRRTRRRSTPLPRSRRGVDSPLPQGRDSPERVFQFTPLRQLLDSRTQRRIRRLGLSSEINNFEREKRASIQYEKSMQLLQHERDSLKQELEVAKRERSSSESCTPADGVIMINDAGVEYTESRNTSSGADVPYFPIVSSQDQSTISEVDTIIINDSAFDGETFLASDSPDIRGLAMHHHSIPDEFSLLGQRIPGVDASAQTSQPCHYSDIATLSLDLEAARKEKKNFFEACRSRLDTFAGTSLERHLRLSSPPPDFLDYILPTLTQTLARASDAASTLDTIHLELYNLGFPGTTTDEIISEIRDRFRTARLELERAVPGETADASLSDGCSTLSALVKRVKALVKDLGEEQMRHEGSADRERALRGQFDNLLVRYETSSKKIHDLEESIASSAGDMLHTRMRMQELEREAQEQIIGIDRLNAALSKYHDEVKGLETLVTQLEDDKAKSTAKHEQRISELESKVVGEENARLGAQSKIAERDALIRELEEVVKQNRIRVCDLTAKVEMLERERCKAVETLEHQAAEEAQRHEQEMGLMNVRVSEVNTALNSARAEVERLRHRNTGLEEQLRLEVETRDNLLDKWAEEQARAFAVMKATINTERRKAKVRTANWELKSNDLQSDSSAIGSEPITPVSMTRFVDVEVGRGKHRRRLDSGVGILTEDELEDDEDTRYEGQELTLPSDPADL